MIGLNTFFDPVGMLFNEKQGGFLAQASKEPKTSFEDIFSSAVKEKAPEPVQKDNQPYRNVDTQKVSTQNEDNSNDVQAQKASSNDDDQVNQASSETDDKANGNQKVVKKDASDSKHVDKKNKFDALSESDKAAVKEMAQKLHVNPETFMNLMQSLNIDFKSLMQNSANLDEALQKVTIAVDSQVQKLNLNPAALQNKDLRAKIELLVNNQKHADVKNDADSKNININADAKQLNVKASEDVQAKAPVLIPQHTELQNKDEHASVGNQAKVDVTDQFAKKVVSQKSDKDFVGTDSNQQGQKDAGQGAVKANDKVDMQAILSNVKVVNLKTVPQKVQNAQNDKVDSLNALSMQKFEGVTNKVIPLTQTIKDVNASKENIFSQVVENAKLTLSDKQTEMEMNLKPESLGKLSIKIASENGMIMAKITTENEQVKAAIESNLAQLKEHLQQQGLSVQDFSVSVGQDSKQQFFGNRNSNLRNPKVQAIGQNTVAANENYVNRIMVKNPYLMSDSSIDYTA